MYPKGMVSINIKSYSLRFHFLCLKRLKMSEKTSHPYTVPVLELAVGTLPDSARVSYCRALLASPYQHQSNQMAGVPYPAMLYRCTV